MEHGMERGKRYRRWSWEDKRRAVERMKTVSSQELAEELGIHKRQLYEWRDQLRQHRGEPATREEQLRRGDQQLPAARGAKARGVGFFLRALRRNEGRPPARDGAG